MLGIWLENKKLTIKDNIPVPIPKSNEALIKVLQAGICNTDLELLQGYYPYTGILGHEFIGLVVEGPNDLLNKRVVGEINATCGGTCYTCRQGRPHHCENRTVLGIVNHHGAFAEYLTLPVANLHVVPENVSSDAATFTEPLAAALEIQQQILIHPTDKVLVLGAGKLGMLIAQTLKLRGCELCVMTRNKNKITLLNNLNITTIDSGALTKKAGYFDVVIEATGNQEGFQQALTAVRPAGTLVMKSTYADQLSVNAAIIVVNEITLVGSRCGPFAPALDLLSKNLIDVSSLIQQRYSLKEGLTAFNKAAEPGMLKVLLDMSSNWKKLRIIHRPRFIMKQTITSFFADLKNFLENEVKPIANELDNNQEKLHQTYIQFVKLGGLRILIPKELNGLGGNRLEWIQLSMLLAQYSGALLFLQAQHQYSIICLKELLPNDKIATLLAAIAEQDIGIGFNRTANTHSWEIISENSGFTISGKLPWVSGLDFFSKILISFEIAKKIYYALIPFSQMETINQEHLSLTISPPIPISVFMATNTVAITLSQFPIHEDVVLAQHELKKSEPKEHPASFYFAGAAKALLVIAKDGKYFSSEEANKQYEILWTKLQNYQEKIINRESSFLELRSEGLMLAEQCALYARIVCGAASLLQSHPISRITREIWQYTIAGYSNEQAIAYLNCF